MLLLIVLFFHDIQRNLYKHHHILFLVKIFQLNLAEVSRNHVARRATEQRLLRPIMCRLPTLAMTAIDTP